MEDYNNIIEGILYLKGDEGIDIKELSLILEISKKEAVEAMDHFIEAYSKRGFDGLQVVDFGIFLTIKKWYNNQKQHFLKQL